jgi:hypothetical protein
LPFLAKLELCQLARPEICVTYDDQDEQ